MLVSAFYSFIYYILFSIFYYCRVIACFLLTKYINYFLKYSAIKFEVIVRETFGSNELVSRNTLKL